MSNKGFLLLLYTDSYLHTFFLNPTGCPVWAAGGIIVVYFLVGCFDQLLCLYHQPAVVIEHDHVYPVGKAADVYVGG